MSPPQWNAGVIDVLLGLGSNLGDRKAMVDEAIARLARLPGSRIVARSSYYRTEPVGPVAQDWFINIAARLNTELEGAALSAACHEIEAALGRDRAAEIPSGPRPIDIDVIACKRAAATGAQTYELRHPRFIAHAFALVPLAEIAADVHLGTKTVAEHLAEVGPSGVERLDWPIPQG
jgi:2-amino-4-hydroxy-6-hydroxymethyldihydropteridine diphosphokinase